jgi:hypothetical protein
MYGKWTDFVVSKCLISLVASSLALTNTLTYDNVFTVQAPVACNRSVRLSVVPLEKAPALLTNIRLGWKDLLCTNTFIVS